MLSKAARQSDHRRLSKGVNDKTESYYRVCQGGKNTQFACAAVAFKEVAGDIGVQSAKRRNDSDRRRQFSQTD
jgi:hypothetical protein